MTKKSTGVEVSRTGGSQKKRDRREHDRQKFRIRWRILTDSLAHFLGRAKEKTAFWRPLNTRYVLWWVIVKGNRCKHRLLLSFRSKNENILACETPLPLAHHQESRQRLQGTQLVAEFPNSRLYSGISCLDLPDYSRELWALAPNAVNSC